MLRTLLTQAGTILRADCSNLLVQGIQHNSERFVHDSPPDALRDFLLRQSLPPHPARCCLNMIPTSSGL